jgi:hypothetical protein
MVNGHRPAACLGGERVPAGEVGPTRGAGGGFSQHDLAPLGNQVINVTRPDKNPDENPAGALYQCIANPADRLPRHLLRGRRREAAICGQPTEGRHNRRPSQNSGSRRRTAAVRSVVRARRRDALRRPSLDELR